MCLKLKTHLNFRAQLNVTKIISPLTSTNERTSGNITDSSFGQVNRLPTRKHATDRLSSGARRLMQKEQIKLFVGVQSKVS